MNKVIYILYIFTFISCYQSNTYNGFVYDENKKALEDVKIQIVGSDIYTYTDQNGFFSIDHKNRGKEILILKSGYEMQFYTPESSKEKINLVLKVKEDE